MWHRDLDRYSIDAIEWACETYARNAKKLPCLADITQLLSAWTVDHPDPSTTDPHKGQGYSDLDVKWLLARRFRDPHPWTAEQWEAALCELDQRRPGGAPEFHRNGRVCFDEPMVTVSPE